MVPHLVRLFLNPDEVQNRAAVLQLLADVIDAARDSTPVEAAAAEQVGLVASSPWLIQARAEGRFCLSRAVCSAGRTQQNFIQTTLFGCGLSKSVCLPPPDLDLVRHLRVAESERLGRGHLPVFQIIY